MQRVVEKPWGREEWISLTDKYCFKRITIFEGCKTSLQYHNLKDETNFVHSGKAMVTFKSLEGEDYSKIVESGFILRCKPRDIHRIEALDGDVILYEVSTPEVDDVVRLEDSYGRKGTSNP